MTSDPPTTGDLHKLMRGVQAWAASAAVMTFAGGMLWALHTVAIAQAERITTVETKVEQLGEMSKKLDQVAEDVSAIREAQAVERERRLGLLQSVPGGESE